MNRWMKAKLPSTSNAEVNVIESIEVMTKNPPVVPSQVDQECQVDFYSNSDINSQTFTCNRYIKDDLCHAETQTEIIEDTRPTKIHSSNKKFVDKECGTPAKTFVDQESQADNKHFNGFTSVKKDQEIIDLAGVSFPNFDFLLTRLPARKKYIISKKDRY